MTVTGLTTLAAFDVRAAGRSDEADLRHLLRTNPMEGEISVSLEREPDVFLAGSIEGHRHDTIVARDTATGRVAGMASRSVYDGFLNGVPRSIGYLGQLRISRESRGRAALPAISRSTSRPSSPTTRAHAACSRPGSTACRRIGRSRN